MLYFTRVHYENLLDALRREKRAILQEQKACPTGRLSYRHGKGGERHFVQIYEQKGRKFRRDCQDNHELVWKLARKEYLQAELKLLNEAIPWLERFVKHYTEPSVEHIRAKLPQWLLDGEIPEEAFLTAANLVDDPDENEGICTSTPWSEQSYDKSDYKSERKVHTTSRGLKVRSKSELLIAELLYKLGIEFRYEAVLQIGRKHYIPDFTLRKPTGEIMYLEHCGMPSRAEYWEHHQKKLKDYERIGIYPWDNLIVTYDRADGELDLLFMEMELRHKVLGESRCWPLSKN